MELYFTIKLIGASVIIGIMLIVGIIFIIKTGRKK